MLLLYTGNVALPTWTHQHACIIQMAKDSVSIGISTNLSTLPPVCQHCILRKQTNKTIPKTRQGGRAGKLLEIVYVDLTSLEDMTSVGRVKYILNLIDDLLGMTWTHSIKEKS